MEAVLVPCLVHLTQRKLLPIATLRPNSIQVEPPTLHPLLKRRVAKENASEGALVLGEAFYIPLMGFTSSRCGLSHLSLYTRGSATVSHCSNVKASPGVLQAVVLNMPFKQDRATTQHTTEITIFVPAVTFFCFNKTPKKQWTNTDLFQRPLQGQPWLESFCY